MEQYTYIIKDKKGETHKGLIEAGNPRQAANILHERGFTILKIERKSEGLNIKFFKKVGIGPLAQLTRQLAIMINAGLPLTDSLVVLQKQTANAQLSQIVKEVAESIQGGSTFASALAKHSELFSTAYINVVKAGEASGTLDKVLLKLADSLEKEREFKGKIKGAMVYPVIIVIAMTIVLAIILIFVIPKLSEVYTGLNITLPLPTRIIMALSSFAVHFWWLIVILGVGGFIALGRYRKTEAGALTYDRWMLKVPVMGKLNEYTSLTEFTRTLGSLVAAGVPILEALKIAGSTATNAVHRQAITQVATQVEKGTVLSKALGNFEVFPAIIPQMVSVGEETGTMDEVLANVSRFFEMEVEQQVKNLTTALEPIIMVVLGIMVGILMISIILPIYSITSAF